MSDVLTGVLGLGGFIAVALLIRAADRAATRATTRAVFRTKHREGQSRVRTATKFSSVALSDKTMDALVQRVNGYPEPPTVVPGLYLASRTSTTAVFRFGSRLSDSFEASVAVQDSPSGGCSGQVTIVRWTETNGLVTNLDQMNRLVERILTAAREVRPTEPSASGERVADRPGQSPTEIRELPPPGTSSLEPATEIGAAEASESPSVAAEDIDTATEGAAAASLTADESITAVRVDDLPTDQVPQHPSDVPREAKVHSLPRLYTAADSPPSTPIQQEKRRRLVLPVVAIAAVVAVLLSIGLLFNRPESASEAESIPTASGDVNGANPPSTESSDPAVTPSTEPSPSTEPRAQSAPHDLGRTFVTGHFTVQASRLRPTSDGYEVKVNVCVRHTVGGDPTVRVSADPWTVMVNDERVKATGSAGSYRTAHLHQGQCNSGWLAFQTSTGAIEEIQYANSLNETAIWNLSGAAPDVTGFLGRWYVHGVTLVVGSTSARSSSALGPCGPELYCTLHIDYRLTPMSSTEIKLSQRSFFATDQNGHPASGDFDRPAPGDYYLVELLTDGTLTTKRYSSADQPYDDATGGNGLGNPFLCRPEHPLSKCGA